MPIIPVGALGGSPQPAPSSTDRRSERRPSTSVTAGRSADPAGDRVVLSETARVLARAAGAEAPQLHLSPAELRAMIAPESADAPLTSEAHDAR
jgi:hypothetical protein